jgi:hypothetical protein
MVDGLGGFLGDDEWRQIEAMVDPMVKLFSSASQEDRELLRARVVGRARDILVAYAGRVSLSINSDKPEQERRDQMQKALMTMALVSDGNDFRDTLCTLNGMAHQLAKLQLSPRLLAETSFFATGRCRQAMANWSRAPTARDLVRVVE